MPDREIRCIDADGLPHGPWSIFFSDGSLVGRVFYEHGVEHGGLELHWPSVRPGRAGRYDRGRRSGVWRTYGRKGELVLERDYSAADRITETYYPGEHEEDQTPEVREHEESPDRCGARPARLPPASRKSVATVLVFDVSGSVLEEVIEEMRRTAATFCASAGEGDEVAVVATRSFAQTVVPMHECGTTDLANALAKMHAGGGSDLVPGLVAAFDELSRTQSRRHVIVFTDAMLPFDCLDEWVRRLRTSQAVVSLVGPRDDPEAMERLSAWGGDDATFIRDPAAMSDAFLAAHRRFVEPR